MARKPDADKHPIALWARDQRKAHGHPTTVELAAALRHDGYAVSDGTLRQFEASTSAPSRPLTEVLERFYGAKAPARDEPVVPPWASSIVDELRGIRQAIEQSNVMAEVLLGQVIRNEAMLTALWRRQGVTEDDWREAYADVVSDEVWASLSAAQRAAVAARGAPPRDRPSGPVASPPAPDRSGDP